ncbi:hypothetical protein GHK80_00005 [Sinorhizobium medicae]|nr:hypothetical protein [Sinorhizobium medicae]
MNLTTAFIAELIRAASEVERLTYYQISRLSEPLGCVFSDVLDEKARALGAGGLGRGRRRSRLPPRGVQRL